MNNYLIKELPKQYMSNDLATDIPVGVYYNPVSGNIIVQAIENNCPSCVWVGVIELHDEPVPLLAATSELISTPAGYPISDVLALIREAKS